MVVVVVGFGLLTRNTDTATTGTTVEQSDSSPNRVDYQDSDVETALQTYLDDRYGPGYKQVFKGGCVDQFYAGDSGALWECVVFVGDDDQRTWVVVNGPKDSPEVVDASQRR